MANKPVGFTRDAAKRILRVVDEIDKAPTRLGTETGRRSPIDVYHVRITSTTLTSGRYPGKRCTYSPFTATWTDHDDVWVVEANGDPLYAGSYYPAYRNAVADARPVWVVGECAARSVRGDIFSFAAAN